MPSHDQSLPPFVQMNADGLKFLHPDYARAFIGLVRSGERISHLLDADLRARHGIGLRGFEVLLFLAVFSDEGTERITDLARRAPLSQSRVSRLVAELADRGLVERSSSSGDARVVSVSITDDGLEMFKRAQETHLRQLDELLFSRLSSDEIAMLARITAKCGDDDDGETALATSATDR